MKIIKNIFIALGIIFLIVVLAIILIIVIKPYGIDITKTIPAMLEENPTSTYDHPYLDTKQESILESAGINLEEVPTQITEEQKECAISILGIDRVNEIVNGSTPSIIEILNVKNCFDID